MKAFAIICVVSLMLHFSAVFAEDSVINAIPNGSEGVRVEDVNAVDRQFDALKKVANDQKQDNEVRIDAILKMRTLNLTNVVDFMLENISLWLLKERSFDDDYLKDYPCFYVLKRKGEVIAPDVLRYLEKGRNTNDLTRVGKLLDEIMGSAKATKLLEQRKQQKENDAASMVLRTNIDMVCSVILEEEQIRKRWKELNDAAQAQGSKREK